MSAFYAGMAAVASRLLKAKGQLVTLSRETRDAPSDANPGLAALRSTTLYSGFGAAFDYPTREVDGKNILRGDVKILLEVATSMVAPTAGDIVTLASGEKHRVINSKALAPGGVTVIYTLQARAGG